jgi:hypothetical protein
MKMFDTQPKAGMPVRHSTFFKALLRMARAWETLKVHNGHVSWSGGMPTIVVDTSGDDAAAAGLDLSKAALGYKIDPAGDDPDLVRIYAGEIDRIAVAQTDLTVANNEYVYVRRTISNNTMLVTKAASVPANDATYIYYRLYRFTVSDGAATIQAIYRPFDVHGGNVIIDIRYDPTTKQLQKKTTAVPGTWTMIEGGQAEECP